MQTINIARALVAFRHPSQADLDRRSYEHGFRQVDFPRIKRRLVREYHVHMAMGDGVAGVG